MTCPASTACQTIKEGVVVCGRQFAEGEACTEPGAPNICTTGDCEVTAFSRDAAGAPGEVLAAGCRVGCSTLGDGSECSGTTECLPDARLPLFVSDFEVQQNAGADVACVEANCEADGVGCTCTAGYECLDLGTTAAPNPVCATLIGMCGNPVKYFTSSNVEAAIGPGGDINDIRCNGVDDLSYCDTRIFADLDEKPITQCVPINYGPGSSENDGGCFAICKFPKQSATDETFESGCGDTLQCNQVAGLAVGLDGACSQAACAPGTICNACNIANPGVVDAQCSSIGCNTANPCPTGSTCTTDTNGNGTCSGDAGECQLPVSTCEDAVDCVFDVDCGAGETCNENACVTACTVATAATDCDAGETCVAGFCAAAPAQCTVENQATTCTIAGQTCINGVCGVAAPECTVENQATTCTTAGETCIAGVCGVAAPECTVANQATTCTVTGETCVNGVCAVAAPECTVATENVDCAAGESCVEGVCETDALATCTDATVAADCAANQRCVLGFCAPECTIATTLVDCTVAGETCVEGVCTAT